MLAIVATLMVLRLSRSRESSRRIECESNLRSLFVAIESYHLQYGQYPIGTQEPAGPIRSEPSGYHHNWLEGLLPQLEEQTLFESIDFRYGVYSPENRTVAEANLEVLMCPSAKKSLAKNSTAYAGVAGSKEVPISEQSDGILILNRPIRSIDIDDGLNYVAIAGEKRGALAASLSKQHPAALPWNSGTRESLRTLAHPINQTPDPAPSRDPSDDPFWVGGFASNHAGGAYILLASGEYRFYGEQTDLQILQQLGGRADSKSDTAIASP